MTRFDEWGRRIWVEDDEAGSRTKPKFIKTQKKQNPNSQYPTKIARERSVLGCDENDRFWVDRCWGATISLVEQSAWWGSEMVRLNGFSGFDEWVFWVWSNGFSGCDRMGLTNGFSRSWVFWVKRSRFLGSLELESVSRFAISLLSLSLSLSLCASESGNTLKWK